MAFPAEIVDPATGRSASVLAHANVPDEAGPLVFTEPWRSPSPASLTFLNPANGASMNVNAAFSGTPDKVHDGTDSALWTGSAVVGNKFTFDSTDQANGGTKSVKVNSPSLGDAMQFDKGSDLTLANYTAITMAVYIDTNWGAADSVEVYGYDTGTDLEVGNRAALKDFFDETTFDTWHAFAIPLTDMDLASGTVDAIRFEYVSRDAPSPLFYVDDVQFEQTGTPAEYTAQPADGKLFRARSLRMVFADALAGTVASGTMPGLAYDKLLALSALTDGLLFQRHRNGAIAESFVINQLSDISVNGFCVRDLASDGTNTMLVADLEFDGEHIFDSRIDDRWVIKISEDLTGLLMLQAQLRGTEESVQ